MSIYQPAEDSYLLSETLKSYLKNKNSNIKILDMGSGSGIQAQTCIKLGFDNLTTVDINPEAITYLKSQKLKTIQSNLFENLNKKYNLIIFNPPYLPEHKHDKHQDTTAGKKGYELIIKFLQQARSHLAKHGEILLLFSSHSQPSIIRQKAKQLGYELKLLNKRNLFFEKLFVYSFS